MKTSLFSLNAGLVSPLMGQGLFGGAGIVAIGDTSAGAGCLGTQYSLALKQVSGRESVASGFLEGRVGHPLFSTANDSQHRIVPTFLLSQAATFSPWTEGARLALGEDRMETVVASGMWRLAGGGSLSSDSASRKTSEQAQLKKLEEWIEHDLSNFFTEKWHYDFFYEFRNLSEKNKVAFVEFLGEKLKSRSGYVRDRFLEVLHVVIYYRPDYYAYRGVLYPSWPVQCKIAEKIVPLLSDENGHIKRLATNILEMIAYNGKTTREELLTELARLEDLKAE